MKLMHVTMNDQVRMEVYYHPTTDRIFFVTMPYHPLHAAAKGPEAFCIAFRIFEAFNVGVVHLKVASADQAAAISQEIRESFASIREVLMLFTNEPKVLAGRIYQHAKVSREQAGIAMMLKASDAIWKEVSMSEKEAELHVRREERPVFDLSDLFDLADVQRVVPNANADDDVQDPDDIEREIAAMRQRGRRKPKSRR